MVDEKELIRKLKEYNLSYNDMGKYMYQVWNEEGGQKWAFYPSTERYISYNKKIRGVGLNNLINELTY